MEGLDRVVFLLIHSPFSRPLQPWRGTAGWGRISADLRAAGERLRQPCTVDNKKKPNNAKSTNSVASG